MAAAGSGLPIRSSWARKLGGARLGAMTSTIRPAGVTPRATNPIFRWFLGGDPMGVAAGLGVAVAVASSIAASAGAAAGTSTVTGASIPPLGIGRAAILQMSWRSGSYPVSGTITTPATDLSVSSINTTTEELTVTAHGIVDHNGDGPLIWHTDGGTVPGGLTEGGAYYAIIVDANTLKLASTDINATTSTAVNITSAGSGSHYLLRKQDTQAHDSMFLVFGVRGTWDIVDVDPVPDYPPFDSFGNTLSAVGSSPIAYASYPASKLGLYVSPSVGSVGGAAHTVSLNYGPYTTGGFEADEATVGFVEIQGPAELLAYAHVERVAAATITSASITISKPARLIALIGGNAGVGQHHAFTFLGGFTKIPGACAEAEITTNGYIQISTAELFVDPGGVATAYTFSAQGTANEGGQMWLLAFAEPNVGSAAGASTVAGIGSSVAAAAGSSTGAGSAGADAVAIASADGSATGTGTASGAAASGDGAGSAAGVGSAAGAGTAIYGSAGAAAGTSAPTAVGAATAAGAGSSAGTSTPTATGAATAAAAGSAGGAGSATATGAATSAAAGSSSGVASPTAVGGAAAAAAGSTTGASTVAATSSAFSESAGDSSGSATAAATGVSTVVSTGAASSSASATAVAVAFVATSGVAAGTSTATGIASPLVLPATLTITGSDAAFAVAAPPGESPFTVAADAGWPTIAADPGAFVIAASSADPFAVVGAALPFTVTATAAAPFTVEEV